MTALILGLLKNPWLWRVLAAAMVLAGLHALHGHIDQAGYARAQAVYEAEINRLKTEAAATLAQETERVRLIEQTLHQSKNKQDLKDAQNNQTIAGLSARLGAHFGLGGAAAPALRLRDPHATPCRCSGDNAPRDPAAAAAAGAADPAQASGLLSEPLAELLRDLTLEADHINAAYASCRADAYTIRAAPVD